MKKLLTTLLLTLFPSICMAAGTIVLTNVDDVPGTDVYIYTYTMTADGSDGSFPVTNTEPIDGWIIRVETNPGATAPTANYDIALVNNEMDVMASSIINRSAANAEQALSPQPFVRGPVAITITNNAVNSAVVVMKITVLR